MHVRPGRNQWATLLADGRVLVTAEDGRAEIWNAPTNRWTSLSSLVRGYPSATRLPDGRVLFAGGDARGMGLNTAEIFDPATLSWNDTGSMTSSRIGHAAVVLHDGRVLVAGGSFTERFANRVLDSAEFFSLSSGG
jgi:hypothetical protein